VVDIASSTYTVKGLGSARSQRIKPGVYFIIRHQVYGGNAFAVTSSRGVAWDAVTVYSIPGMGFYAGDSTDLTLQSTAIRRRPGRPMSITAGIPPFPVVHPSLASASFALNLFHARASSVCLPVFFCTRCGGEGMGVLQSST